MTTLAALRKASYHDLSKLFGVHVIAIIVYLKCVILYSYTMIHTIFVHAASLLHADGIDGQFANSANHSCFAQMPDR